MALITIPVSDKADAKKKINEQQRLGNKLVNWNETNIIIEDNPVLPPKQQLTEAQVLTILAQNYTRTNNIQII